MQIMAKSNVSIAVPTIRSVADVARVADALTDFDISIGTAMLKVWPGLRDLDAAAKSDERKQFDAAVRAAFDANAKHAVYMVRNANGTYAICKAGAQGAERVTVAGFKGRDRAAWGKLKSDAPTRHAIESAYNKAATRRVIKAWQNVGEAVRRVLANEAPESDGTTRSPKSYFVRSLDSLTKVTTWTSKAAEKAELSADESRRILPRIEAGRKAPKAEAPKAEDIGTDKAE
jgi:hypothetical protein